MVGGKREEAGQPVARRNISRVRLFFFFFSGSPPERKALYSIKNFFFFLFWKPKPPH